MSEEKDPNWEVFLANVSQVAKTRAGQEVLWHILSLTNLHSDVFTGDSHTFYLEGQRSIGLQILQVLEEADPTLYPKLILAMQDKQNG